MMPLLENIFGKFISLDSGKFTRFTILPDVRSILNSYLQQCINLCSWRSVKTFQVMFNQKLLPHSFQAMSALAFGMGRAVDTVNDLIAKLRELNNYDEYSFENFFINKLLSLLCTVRYERYSIAQSSPIYKDQKIQYDERELQSIVERFLFSLIGSSLATADHGQQNLGLYGGSANGNGRWLFHGVPFPGAQLEYKICDDESGILDAKNVCQLLRQLYSNGCTYFKSDAAAELSVSRGVLVGVDGSVYVRIFVLVASKDLSYTYQNQVLKVFFSEIYELFNHDDLFSFLTLIRIPNAYFRDQVQSMNS